LLNLGIRTDSSAVIGTGHIVRCTALAQELRNLGTKVRFISKPYKGNILNFVKKNKFLVSEIKEDVNLNKDIQETKKIIKKFKLNYLIVDNYNLNLVWEKEIKKHVKKLIVINDFIRKQCCDVLINHNALENGNIKKHYSKNLVTDCKNLIGLRYAILNSKYAYLKKEIKFKKKIKKIHIFFGGYKNSLSLLNNVINVLSNKNLKKIKLDIIIGLNQKINKTLNYKLQARGNYKIFKNLPNLADLLKKSNLAIGCGGMANIERLCLIVPSFVFIAAKNQASLVNDLAKKNIVVKLKKRNNQIDKIFLLSSIKKYLNENKYYNNFNKIKHLVDGNGAKRVARAVLGEKNLHLKIRKANKNDLNIFFNMASDFAVRNNAFLKKKIKYEDHIIWFKNKIKSLDTHMFVAEDVNGLILGQIRLDFNSKKNKYCIDISTDECARGLGVGKKFLSKLTDKLSKLKLKSKNLYAEVLKQNIVSQKLFQSCNFIKVNSNKKNVIEYNFQLK